jgi:uncharacterized protein (TIGR01244 family)
MKRLAVAIAVVFAFSTPAPLLNAQEGERARLDRIEQDLKDDVPRLLCLNDSLATGAQPSEQAFGKIAASGFRSVLNLRTAAEGVDLEKERASVQRSGMRYFHIPVISTAPRAEQADEFIRVVREKAHHPMLIHCASANRVGAFMMIYRVLEHGWNEKKALDEAVKIGLSSDGLKKFAESYIAQHKTKKG